MLHRSFGVLAMVLASLLTLTSAAVISPCLALMPYPRPLEQIISDLAPPPSDQALSQIPDLGRKLLALRIYLRTGSRLAGRWSWTDEEIKAFQASAEQKALLDEIAAVSAYFAQANPGFEIYANTNIRSLDIQIRNWNDNESVGIAADEILSKWKEKFGADAAAWDKLDAKTVRNWLNSFEGTSRAAIAAPGLSFHGQARAIDFQVKQNGTIVAGTNSKKIESDWRAAKWDIKLNESILAAGPSFKGPLASPDEPWHYEYHPGSQTVKKEKNGAGASKGETTITASP